MGSPQLAEPAGTRVLARLQGGPEGESRAVAQSSGRYAPYNWPFRAARRNPKTRHSFMSASQVSYWVVTSQSNPSHASRLAAINGISGFYHGRLSTKKSIIAPTVSPFPSLNLNTG